MPTFVAELRRRNVLRVAAAYALIAWIIIEAGSVLLPTFGASDTTFQIYVVAVLLGFLVALVLAWVFEVTADGVKLDRDVDRSAAATGEKKGITNYAIIGLLVIALAVSVTFNLTDIRKANEASAAEIMSDRQSIAVLPFTSRSTDPENALFADGVHDNLLTKLANTGTLKVISRTSVMEYRDTTKNIRQVGRELDVDTLLEGAVQRIGNNVRINVQLIDAETDEHLWAKIYDRQLTTDNLFKVQSDVSAEIAAALYTALMPDAELFIADVPTENLRAYSLFKSGRDNLYLRRLDSLQLARTQFEEAIELDPEYAEAYIALAECLILLSVNHQALPREESFALAENNIEKGLELDVDVPDAYATLGLLKTSVWTATRIGTENLQAEEAFEQALAQNPNNARAYMWFANLRDAEQRPDEAIGYYHRSMQLDPLGRVPYGNLPLLYAQKGENDYAIRLWLDAIELLPDWPAPYQNLTLQLAAMGRLDEAVAWQMLTLEKSTEAEQMGNLMVGIFVEFGDLDRAMAMLELLPEGHPLSSLTPGFRFMLQGDFGAASVAMMEIMESDQQLPGFVHGVASDVALLAGDLVNARKYMLIENPVLQLDSEIEINRFTARDVVKLAYIDRMEGDNERSTELLNAALPVVQSLPRQGIFGQGVRDAQIYVLLGQVEDAFAALDSAIEAGYRSSVITDQWTLQYDPYFESIREDERFVAILDRLDTLNGVMYERVLEAERSGSWKELTDLAGSI